MPNEDFISTKEEQELISEIDKREWAGLGKEPNAEMKRRTQHYGYEFSYRHRAVVGRREMPLFAQRLQERVMALAYGDEPNSVIINEYEAGQGIMPHIDAPHVFGTCVYALSLLSSCIMRFDGPNTYNVVLPPRSLVIMKGEAREVYKHSIGKELMERTGFSGMEELLKYDDLRMEGEELVISRSRRVSLTFRRMRMAEEGTAQQTMGLDGLN